MIRDLSRCASSQRSGGSAFDLYDEVRITALHKSVHFEPDNTSRRAPRVGDVATIVEVYTNPAGYELECSDADGITEWLWAFAPDDVELEKR